MWPFVLRQVLKQSGRMIAGKFFDNDLNGPEAYADRIKRDFHLHEYADAWALYRSDPVYWEKYYAAPPKPAWKDELVHDSAAAAGVPSRYNVFEYGFPEAGGTRPLTEVAPRTGRSTAHLAPAADSAPVGGLAAAAAQFLPTPRWSAASRQSVAGTGPSTDRPYPDAIPYLPQAVSSVGSGLPGLIASVTGSDPSDPSQFLPPAGGLLGLIQDYMRNNPAAGGSR